jgi:two-component system, chemotaxis family, CheB/CheR fusion protein
MTVQGTDQAFEALLEFLKRNRGLDFTGYKRASLERRFRRRMDAAGVGSFEDYLDHLEVQPDEYRALFDTLLINVTEFFRDGAVWDFVREEVLPGILDAQRPDEPVRVWSAGCATGQEAYTIAMVLAELLGEDAFRRRAKIYATDIDEDALTTARLGVYTAQEAESVPPELRERYFERADQGYAFRKDLRRTLIFGRNNLVSDAPISRLHLLVCRNTLMYFTAETQSRILRNFHFALGEDGKLMLGKSEMMVSERGLFAPLDLRQRVFGRPTGAGRDALPLRAAVAAAAVEPEVGAGTGPQAARDAALELSREAQVVVDTSGVVAYANQAARALLDLDLSRIGRPLSDLALAQRPAEIRGSIEEALRVRRRIDVGEVGFSPRVGEERRLEVSVTPLPGPSPEEALGALVTYADVTRSSALRSELEVNRRDLELAYEELQSTIDELETTNEELQSANEELQTTNEELQSTNEELETMNEELQSTNEELETINDELRDRTGELNRVNDFLETILGSVGLGVVLVDPNHDVRVWSRRAEDLWGTRADEAIDRNFLSLDIGLPTERVAGGLRAVLAGTRELERVELEAVNRRGRTIVCAVTVLPFTPSGADGGRPRGAVVLMEERGASDADASE